MDPDPDFLQLSNPSWGYPDRIDLEKGSAVVSPAKAVIFYGAGSFYPGGNWSQFWLRTAKAVTEETTKSYLVVARSGPAEASVENLPIVGTGQVTLTIGADKKASTAATVNLTGTAAQWVRNDGSGVVHLEPPVAQMGEVNVVDLLPVEVVELSPKTKDEEGNDIAGSEKPNIGNQLTPYVEIDPNANKIAHREIKVKIGDALKDKKVTWTLEALPGATPATIRGQWEDSPTHKDRFEASTAYGANGFRKVSQSSGETTVRADGHTGIRVNVPPIGFNQVRIKIQIEGMSKPMDLINMEVPGIVVIDPGHGGQDSGAVGRTDTSILEKDLALEYSLSLRQEVIAKFAAERHGLRMVMTRKTTGEYMENSARANLARDKGADVFISVHFNSGASSVRGTETLVRGDSNVNEPEDTTLANLFLASSLAANAISAQTTPQSGLAAAALPLATCSNFMAMIMAMITAMIVAMIMAIIMAMILAMIMAMYSHSGQTA